MGLFERKNCERCGKELGLIFGKVKIADGHICKDCNALLSPLLTGKSKLTLADIEEHLEYRKHNAEELKTFCASSIISGVQTLYFDNSQNKFVIYGGSNYVEKNIDVLDAKDITSCQMVVDEDEEEIFTTDKEGKEVSYDPPKYIKKYAYKVEINLNHRWVHSLTMDVNIGEIEESDKDGILRAENLAAEIIAKLTNTEYIPKENAEDEETDEEHWICSECGSENVLSSKFCTNCGTARAPKAKFCGSCGEKLPDGVKFCPNCGSKIE